MTIDPSKQKPEEKAIHYFPTKYSAEIIKESIESGLTRNQTDTLDKAVEALNEKYQLKKRGENK